MAQTTAGPLSTGYGGQKRHSVLSGLRSPGCSLQPHRLPQADGYGSARVLMADFQPGRPPPPPPTTLPPVAPCRASVVHTPLCCLPG